VFVGQACTALVNIVSMCAELAVMERKQRNQVRPAVIT
jgi:hypothetical protein